jgi:putative ABC transport system ATP-binding protein
MHRGEDVGTTETIINAEGLRVARKVKGGRKNVLQRISLGLCRGEMALLKGASGAGKTTLLWALARMLPLQEGRLVLLGRPAAKWPVREWRSRVALVLQDHAPLPGTVRQNLLLPWSLNILAEPREGSAVRSVERPDDEEMREELRVLGLAGKVLDEDASRLSQGQKARIAQARALLTKPDCLLLDEPLAALDPESASMVMERIRRFLDEGGTALITGHWIAEGEAGKTFHLDGGRLEGDQE